MPVGRGAADPHLADAAGKGGLRVKRKHKVKIFMRITTQTEFNLQRLCRMTGLSVGQVVDKLVRQQMLMLRGASELWEGRQDDGRG